MEKCRSCQLDDCLECLDCELYTEEERTDVGDGISKETFNKMDTDAKLSVLFDYVVDIHNSAPKRVRDRDIKCAKRQLECDKRFGAIEDECDNAKARFDKVLKLRMILNTSAALAGGFIGGFMAVWAHLKLGLLIH